MKKSFLLSLVTLWVVMSVNAQTAIRPEGLYRLQSFIYEDGRTQTPGFYQYKYAADSVGLLVFYRNFESDSRWNNLQVEIRESHPLVETGEEPQGSDGHGTQIFNVDKSQFFFKWYNDRWSNMSKLNEFITEVYVKKDIQKEVAKAFELFENKQPQQANRFYGWWVRVAATSDPDGSGTKRPVGMIWKAYGPDLSLVVNISKDGKTLNCNPTSTIQYQNDTTLYEIGHPCQIHWLNDDSHALTFVQENGQQLTEIWVRSGLPQMWQDVFNTSIPVFKTGTDCVRSAAEAAKAGDLSKADQLLSEAVNEKNVNIGVLCSGIEMIARHLFADKQQYAECKDFCERQLQAVKDYAAAGNDHTMYSRLQVHLTEVYSSIATYRSGHQKDGLRLMEDKVAEVESEIERFRSLGSADSYINLLYYCNFTMFHFGYDILGSERTLLYLDFLTLMAPAMTEKMKPLLLNCRGNCYLLNNDQENAQKVWQQIKALNPDFFRNEPADSPLKKAFGE